MRAQPTLLLTRPQVQSEGFATACRAAGWDHGIEISPVMAIMPRPMPNAPAPGTTLIFTSANGVAQAVAQQDLSGFSAYAVGDKTARLARAAGMACVSADGNVADLLALLLSLDVGPMVHLHGAHSTGDLAAHLTAQGKTAESWVIYDQTECPLSCAARTVLMQTAPVILPLFSPRSAALLSKATAQASAPITPIAISAAAAAVWSGPGKTCTITRPNAVEMVQRILRYA